VDAAAFLSRLEKGTPSLERAVGLIWLASRVDHAAGLTPREICDLDHEAGHPAVNVPRLSEQLGRDRRVSQSKGRWRVRPQARKDLDDQYSFAVEPLPPPPSDSVLSRALFDGTRGYLEKVVDQINKSYDAQLWDCCAVMGRRLLETLIIEVYEHDRRSDEIKGPDGNFKMFNGLIDHILSDRNYNLSRNTVEGLKEQKRLGDLSAHNRRYNAQPNDIKKNSGDLRVAAEELLHLSGLHPKAT